MPFFILFPFVAELASLKQIQTTVAAFKLANFVGHLDFYSCSLSS